MREGGIHVRALWGGGGCFEVPCWASRGCRGGQVVRAAQLLGCSLGTASVPRDHGEVQRDRGAIRGLPQP
jgi:hypothetical protein